MSVVKWSSPGKHTAEGCWVLMKQVSFQAPSYYWSFNSWEELRPVVGPPRPFLLRVNSVWIEIPLILEVGHFYRPLRNVWLLKRLSWDWRLAHWVNEVLASLAFTATNSKKYDSSKVEDEAWHRRLSCDCHTCAAVSVLHPHTQTPQAHIMHACKR